MKQVISFLILLSAVFLNASAQAEWKIPENVKRILFLGNSITYNGQYVAYIEAYLKILHPEKQIEYINAGLPSETVSGLSETGDASLQWRIQDMAT